MTESQIDESSDLGAENPPGGEPTPAQNIENVEGDAVVEAPDSDGDGDDAPSDDDSE